MVKMEFNVLGLDVLHRSEQPYSAAFSAHNNEIAADISSAWGHTI